MLKLNMQVDFDEVSLLVSMLASPVERMINDDLISVVRLQLFLFELVVVTYEFAVRFFEMMIMLLHLTFVEEVFRLI